MWRSSLQQALPCLVWASLLAGATALRVGGADVPPAEGGVVVHPDGSVVVQTAAATFAPGDRGVRQVRFRFGLPGSAPVRRWLEDDRLPICQTLWEKDGIRYTQMVLVSRLGPGDPPAAGRLTADATLLVQLVGENFTNVYAEASATLSVEVDGQPLSLHLRDSLAYATNTQPPRLVAVIDVPTSGIASPDGQHLRFQGSMPPGTSGSMTIKIPAAAMRELEATNRLRDLEFADELSRVKRFWAGRPQAETPPVTLSRQIP